MSALIVNSHIHIRDTDRYDLGVTTQDLLTDFQNNVAIKALSLHIPENQFTYSPVSDIRTGSKSNAHRFYRLRFSNSLEQQYELICSHNTQIYIHNRGFVNAESVWQSNMAVDFENRLCKFISSDYVSKNLIPETLYQIDVKYHYNFFCNGVLIR